MTIKAIKIRKRKIGEKRPCYIIAEIGSNFDGSFLKAKKMIKLAKDAGADAAKFQSFTTEQILSKKGFEKKTTFQSKWKKPIWEVYKNAEFPLLWHEKLNEYAKKIGIDFLSTPYNYDAVKLLKKINIPAIKIGSGDITDTEFLKVVAKTKKPIFLATGASTMKEVKEAVKIIKSSGNNKIILMQSITQYPSPIEEANLEVLNTFKDEFKLNVGYSDHSPGSLIILASVALGACVIEKHFTDNVKINGPDHPHSMNPKEFAKMVKEIRLIESAKGDGIKKVEKSEKETRIIQRRSVFTIKKIRKNEKFTRDNIMTLRPFIGLPASEFGEILNKKAKRDLDEYVAISLKDV
ncbi:NeuB family protein [Candidatus Nitrosopumilus salaria BD31]|uniref:NeuB family protein n=1 Tax=Candidatus Nitrosopumilus salarius BD31 TaxID=859350 RepID=I3D5A9_9ARCH|nr:N-acetylneuraminate synthase family protein [Candidatus Nitrosopumilus salaria]EIJ66902.1 NeuB family protein [Candidatus Nitrosopumilus salaria BD31]